mgnify:FL=1
MTDKYQNKYRIPSSRAAWHDYNNGDYFITICTHHHEHYFGEIENGEMILNDLGMKLNELIIEIPTHHRYSKIPIYQIMPNHLHLIICIDDTMRCRDVAGRDAAGRDVAGRDAAGHVSTGTDAAGGDAAGHVSTTEITPNNNRNKKMKEIAGRCGLLSVVIGGFKSAVTKFVNENRIPFGWQTRFHDHIIRDPNEWEKITNYIMNNPATWENDKFYTK